MYSSGCLLKVSYPRRLSPIHLNDVTVESYAWNSDWLEEAYGLLRPRFPGIDDTPKAIDSFVYSTMLCVG